MLGLPCFAQAFTVAQRLLIAVGSLVAEHGLQGSQAQLSQLTGSRVQALWLQHTDLVALQHMESSQTRDKPMSPCIGRRIPSTVPPGKSRILFSIEPLGHKKFNFLKI